MKVSVIIAAFNAERTVGAAVNSALTQTLTDLEVLVVDDGSGDDTAAVVEACARDDVRVKLIRHPSTCGVSVARNSAIAQARGEWLAVLDADDAFEPNRLTTLIDDAERRDLDIIIDNLQRVDASTGELLGLAFPSDWMATPNPVPLSFIMEHDFPGRHPIGIGYCKPIFRAEVLRDRAGGYTEGIHCGEDVLALQTAMFAGARVGVHPGAFYIYHVNPRSLSSRVGAYPDVSRVNRRIRGLDRRCGGSMRTLLNQRQAAIDYDGFVKAAKQRRWGELAYFLSSVPKGRLVRGLSRAALKRLGFPVVIS